MPSFIAKENATSLLQFSDQRQSFERLRQLFLQTHQLIAELVAKLHNRACQPFR